jgi:hypothetical protein
MKNAPTPTRCFVGVRVPARPIQRCTDSAQEIVEQCSQLFLKWNPTLAVSSARGGQRLLGGARNLAVEFLEGTGNPE